MGAGADIVPLSFEPEPNPAVKAWLPGGLVDRSADLAAFLRIGFRCWPLAGPGFRRGARVGPPLALPARLALYAGFTGANPSRWSRRGPVLAPPCCASQLPRLARV